MGIDKCAQPPHILPPIEVGIDHVLRPPSWPPDRFIEVREEGGVDADHAHPLPHEEADEDHQLGASAGERTPARAGAVRQPPTELTGDEEDREREDRKEMPDADVEADAQGDTPVE